MGHGLENTGNLRAHTRARHSLLRGPPTRDSRRASITSSTPVRRPAECPRRRGGSCARRRRQWRRGRRAGRSCPRRWPPLDPGTWAILLGAMEVDGEEGHDPCTFRENIPEKSSLWTFWWSKQRAGTVQTPQSIREGDKYHPT